MAEISKAPPALAGVYWRPGCPFCFQLRQAFFVPRFPVAWNNI
jgi:hypothetical protein